MVVPEKTLYICSDGKWGGGSRARSDKSLVNVTWADFIQEGWGTAVDKGEAIANVDRFEIGFKGSAGTTNSFSIYAIGKYGTCDR